jgi:hypothetical protein
MNAVDVKDIRTDVIVELIHNLYRRLWKINDELDLLQEELNRRENIIVNYE